MENNSSIGRIGEEIACEYLARQGFKVLERNFRRPWGELDVIAKDKNETLVFIEVKTMRYDGLFAGKQGSDDQKNIAQLRISPEDNMNASKLRKTKKIAAMYANENPEMINEQAGWRIDLIAISIFGSVNASLTDLIKNCEIKHFENVE